jgi:hypothetical protein
VEDGSDVVEARRHPRQRVPSAVVGSRRQAPPCVDFFLFFFLFVVRLNSGAWQRRFNTISKGAPSVDFF